MKISINTLRFINKHYQASGELAPDGLEALAMRIGMQLGAIEEMIDVGSKYTGVLVVRIVSCEQHPNADRLHVCKIDDGGKTTNVRRDEAGHIQVVCGAPNVRADMRAVWLAPGVTVPNTYGKEPFVLEARELRGQTSNGMMASLKELGLGESHDGILEVDAEIAPGTPFAEAYNLLGDYVLDIENKMFTHRPDCFGFLGVAREIAGIQRQPYHSPAWYRVDPRFPEREADELALTVRNEIPELVPRFTAVVLSDVQVGPSPVWLQIALHKLGLRSINNVVDYTNFFMLETGQPLHAYDYDKVKAQDDHAEHATLVIRKPKSQEKILLLNGKEIEPRADAIMIATENRLIGLGGVMGGNDTEVDGQTKNVIIECATFDMYSIRRTSMTHGLFTDAVTRFNKGQSPLQNLAVLAKIVEEVRQFAGGKVASAVIDDNHLDAEILARKSLHPAIILDTAFINDRLGLHLGAEEIKVLLENVEFDVALEGTSLTITAPFWRTDIEIPEDVVEEVGRLYGYDKLPLDLPRRAIMPAGKDELLECKARLREALSRAGANEVLTYSFVHGDLLDKVGQDRKHAFRLSNALSPDLQYYRLSLLPSLLEKIHPNAKAGYGEFALFEIGKTHELIARDAHDVPLESNNVAAVYADATGDRAGAAYYDMRALLSYVMDQFGLALECRPLNHHVDAVDAPFELKRAASIGVLGSEESFGVIGEFTGNVCQDLKLPRRTAGFELKLDTLMRHRGVATQYVAQSRFPRVEQDICLRVTSEMPYQQLFNFMIQTLEDSRPKDVTITLNPVDIYQRAEDAAHKQITLRVSAISYERTLTDAEVARLLEHAASAAHVALLAGRV